MRLAPCHAHFPSVVLNRERNRNNQGSWTKGPTLHESVEAVVAYPFQWELGEMTFGTCPNMDIVIQPFVGLVAALQSPWAKWQLAYI